MERLATRRKSGLKADGHSKGPAGIKTVKEGLKKLKTDYHNMNVVPYNNNVKGLLGRLALMTPSTLRW